MNETVFRYKPLIPRMTEKLEYPRVVKFIRKEIVKYMYEKYIALNFLLNQVRNCFCMILYSTRCVYTRN